MCIEVFPVFSEQDCWRTRRPTRGWGPAASVSYFRLKLASRITSSFSPGPSRWASVSAGLLPAWHSAALSESVCIISLWSFLRDWCISIESLIYMVWLQIKKIDFVLACCNHSLVTMFETKFVRWSVVYLLSDINLCLHHWDALFLVKKNSILVNLVHSCGVNLIGLLMPSLYKKEKALATDWLCGPVHGKGNEWSFLTL